MKFNSNPIRSMLVKCSIKATATVMIFGLARVPASWASPEKPSAPGAAVQCQACHGANGISNNPEWPNLAGQKAAYLIKQMQAFRSGERKNSLMTPMAKVISEADIEALAQYYANLK